MKSKFLIVMILVFIVMMSMFTRTSFAITVMDDVIGDGDDFIGRANTTSDYINTTKLQDISNDVYNMILAIGMVIAVVIGLILGIQYMITSVEEKAKIKQTLTIYVIGCVVLFGAFMIWKIVMTILGNI